MTNILNGFSHNVITNFVESACWPDDVKKFGLNSMNSWHFIDLPVKYNTDKILLKKEINYQPDDALGTIVKLIINYYLASKF